MKVEVSMTESCTLTPLGDPIHVLIKFLTGNVEGSFCMIKTTLSTTLSAIYRKRHS